MPQDLLIQFIASKHARAWISPEELHALNERYAAAYDEEIKNVSTFREANGLIRDRIHRFVTAERGALFSSRVTITIAPFDPLMHDCRPPTSVHLVNDTLVDSQLFSEMAWQQVVWNMQNEPVRRVVAMIRVLEPLSISDMQRAAFVQSAQFRGVQPERPFTLRSLGNHPELLRMIAREAHPPFAVPGAPP